MKRTFGRLRFGRTSVGLLIIRIFFGVGLVEHGLQKIHVGVFHWADEMAKMPIHLIIPPFFQGLATFAEFCGGLAMIFGLFTPLAMLGLIITMSFAILKFHLPQGENYVGQGHGDYEAAARYLIIAVGLLVSGPGALSLDTILFRRRRDVVE